MNAVLSIAVICAFAACLLSAITTDIRSMRIPNWISLALIGLFPAYVIVAEPAASALAHVAVAIGTLTLAFLLFAGNCLGAGDAKLLAALALWMGPHHIAPFLALMAIAGGVFVLILMIAHALALRYAALNGYQLFARPSHWMRGRKVPYGVPICLAAGAMTPALF